MRGAAFVLWMAVFAQPSVAQEFSTLKGHGGPIMDIAIAEGGQVATASFDNSIGLWTGRSARWLDGHDAAVTVVIAAADGTLYSGGDDFTVRKWVDGTSTILGRHKGKVSSLALNPTNGTLASGSWDGSIAIWAQDESRHDLPAPRASVNDIVYSLDGTTLFAATAKGDILRYDLSESSDPLPVIKHGFGVNKLLAGDGWLAYGAVDGGTRVIEPETGAPLADFTLDRRPILSMAYHAPTHQIAVGDGQGFIMMLDSHQWEITRDFRATRRGPVWALAFSRDGQSIYAGGLDDVAYSWPVSLLDEFDPSIGQNRDFMRKADTMPNGERQFMRKCSICHALDAGPSRKAGPSLHKVFGRRAGTLPDYRYSDTLNGSEIIWDAATIDALFDQGPDHYIPGSKMPMQVISGAQDRADLVNFLRQATSGE